jgi:hypothetical protein
VSDGGPTHLQSLCCRNSIIDIKSACYSVVNLYRFREVKVTSTVCTLLCAFATQCLPAGRFYRTSGAVFF